MPARENVPKISVVATTIEEWFTRNARDLPWRHQRTGYSALVSELMLQQTQVSRVIDKYTNFMARFPTAKALARAPESEVLAAWQGLGYYRRARFLHAAAKVVVEEHAGVVPMEREALMALPGVGRYSAGSIASIVDGRREAIVDGNVSRVFQRLAAREGSVNEKSNAAWAWVQAQRFVDASTNPAKANEGLMELGASICTPAAPKCESCPLAAQCLARKRGVVGAIPAAKPRAVKQELVLLSVRITRSDGAILLEQRAQSGLWGGLWQPPTVEVVEGAEFTPIAAAKRVAVTAKLTRATEVSCTLTHRSVRFMLYHGSIRGKGAALEVQGRRFVTREEIANYAMSNAVKRLLDLRLS